MVCFGAKVRGHWLVNNFLLISFFYVWTSYPHCDQFPCIYLYPYWCAAVHGVTKSQTWMSDWTLSSTSRMALGRLKFYAEWQNFRYKKWIMIDMVRGSLEGELCDLMHPLPLLNLWTLSLYCPCSSMTAEWPRMVKVSSKTLFIFRFCLIFSKMYVSYFP